MKVTDIKIAKRANIDENSHVVADVTVVLGDCLLLRGLKIMRAVNGLYVNYPTDPRRDFFVYITPITRELHDHIEYAVLERYHLGELDPMDAGSQGR